MTWEQLADKANLDARLLFFWANSTNEPRLVNIYRIAEAFDLTAAEMMEGVDGVSS